MASTKLILTQEVTGLGAPGDVVEVKGGYARNYLLPRGFATIYTKGAERQIESIRAARKAREIKSIDEATALRDALHAKIVDLRVKAGPNGRLFGAVTPAEIAKAVEASGVGTVDKRKIEVTEPIKALGSYKANVRLHEDVSAVIDLRVIAG